MKKKTKQKNNNIGALELIVLRNEFYRDNYRRAALIVVILLVLNVMLGGLIYYKTTHPPRPQYFATTADGRVIAWHPLSDPVVTDDFVLQWSANAVRRAFSLDYLHWKKQLQDASSAFTPAGWRYFLQSLKQSNNLSTLTSLSMVSSAEITGAPSIKGRQIIDGVFAWKVQVPILVTYTNQGRTIPMPMDVTLIVVRVSVQENPDRIAIRDFLPIPQKSEE